MEREGFLTIIHSFPITIIYNNKKVENINNYYDFKQLNEPIFDFVIFILALFKVKLIIVKHNYQRQNK